MKLKMQVIFKNGNSLQGETYPKDFDAFIKKINKFYDLSTRSKISQFFEIYDHTNGKSHSILLNLAEINAFVFEEIEEPAEVPKREGKEEKPSLEGMES